MGNTITKSNLSFNLILNKTEAQEILNNAEKQDFYLEECIDDKSNSLARKNLTYFANSVPFKEINNALNFLSNIKEFIPIRLLNDLTEIKIIQLMPTADGGMPHTRPGNIICYPDITLLFSNTTLIHELWHIHQRNYKSLWNKVFNNMKWKLWNGNIPNELEQFRRYNPDTIDCPFWIFKDEWIPIPIFKNISKPNVSDVEIWFYNIKKNYHIKRIPEEILNYYPGLPATGYEHPREITAYMLSEPDRYRDSPGFKDLIESIGEISIIYKT